MSELSWCEVDVGALEHNVRTLKSLLPAGCLLAPTVKANAYGHDLVIAARAFLDGGADWLCVNALFEAAALRHAGIMAPLHVMGFVPPEDVEEALVLDCRFVVYRGDVVEKAEDACARRGLRGHLHLKLETGNERQGLRDRDALDLARRIHDAPHLELEGVASHYANIEDTTDHSFARAQLCRFNEFLDTLQRAGIEVPLPHFSNSAAVILWSDEHRKMARVGISAYGLWPSSETLVAALLAGRKAIELRPALTWKTRMAQVKDVPKGASVGYGCSYQTTAPTRLAVLPIGYYDGYDRRLSNVAYALIRGQRAPIRGRVCMNMTMIDVTDVPGLRVDDEVVLLGRDGDAAVTAEQMASWIGTINYEVLTRIGSHVPRRAVRRDVKANDPRARTLPQ
jgi:alanine racemase